MSKVYVLTRYEEEGPSKPEYSDTVIQHSYHSVEVVFATREAAIDRLREIAKEWRKDPSYEAQCVEEYFSIREDEADAKFEFTIIDERYSNSYYYTITEMEVK